MFSDVGALKHRFIYFGSVECRTRKSLRRSPVDVHNLQRESTGSGIKQYKDLCIRRML